MPKRSELTPKQYKLLCKKVLARDRFTCRNPQCKRRGNLHCHHIVFRSHGGKDESSNMVTICHSCHDLAHNLVKDQKLLILAKSGNPEDKPNADIGLRFISQ